MVSLVAAASCWVKVVCFSVFHCAVGTLDILGCIIFCNDIERHDWCQRFEEWKFCSNWVELNLELYKTRKSLKECIFAKILQITNTKISLKICISFYYYFYWKFKPVRIPDLLYKILMCYSQKLKFKSILKAYLLLSINVLKAVGACQQESFTLLNSIYVNESLIYLNPQTKFAHRPCHLSWHPQLYMQI